MNDRADSSKYTVSGVERPDAGVPEGPSDDAKLAFIKAHAAVMGEWEVTDGWEEALGAGLRAAYAVDRLHAEEKKKRR